MNGFVRASAFLVIYSSFASIQGLSTRCLGQEAGQSSQASKSDWKRLHGHWASCQFGGEGTIEIDEDRIKIASGQPLTGLFWEQNHSRDTQNAKDDVGDSSKVAAKMNPLIRDGYELKLQARRTDGFDFFCGLTFPIADQHATLVLGGWGGAITGLSSIDGLDASENDTTLFRQFEDNRWYRVRIRVSPELVQCWVDDESIVKVSRRKHKFSLRTEMDLCKPLGIAAYECDAEYKDIMIRKLFKTELKTTAQEKAKR